MRLLITKQLNTSGQSHTSILSTLFYVLLNKVIKMGSELPHRCSWDFNSFIFRNGLSAPVTYLKCEESNNIKKGTASSDGGKPAL